MPTFTDMENLNTTRCYYNATVATSSAPTSGYIVAEGCAGGMIFQQYRFTDFDMHANPASISRWVPRGSPWCLFNVFCRELETYMSTFFSFAVAMEGIGWLSRTQWETSLSLTNSWPLGFLIQTGSYLLILTMWIHIPFTTTMISATAPGSMYLSLFLK